MSLFTVSPSQPVSTSPPPSDCLYQVLFCLHLLFLCCPVSPSQCLGLSLSLFFFLYFISICLSLTPSPLTHTVKYHLHSGGHWFKPTHIPVNALAALSVFVFGVHVHRRKKYTPCYNMWRSTLYGFVHSENNTLSQSRPETARVSPWSRSTDDHGQQTWHSPGAAAPPISPVKCETWKKKKPHISL